MPSCSCSGKSPEVHMERNDNRTLTRCVLELRMKVSSFDLSKEPMSGKRMKSSSVEIKWKPVTYLFKAQDNLFTKVNFELCGDDRWIGSHSDLCMVLLLVHHEEKLSVCVKDVEEWVLLILSKSWRFKFKSKSEDRDVTVISTSDSS
ncbi:hypothetical protein Bca4012_009543 [Brassica carinata]